MIGDPLLLYAFFNTIYAIFSLPMGILSDKIGRKRLLTVGYALFAVTAAGFSIVSSGAGLVLLFALYGLVFSIVDASERAFISDLSRATMRSSSLGMYYGVIGIAAIFSGLAAGGLWARLGPSTTFIFGAAMAALAALALWKMKNVEEIQ